MNEARKKQRRAYYEANREKIIAAATAWNKANPEKAKRNVVKSVLKGRYNITPEEREAQRDKQGNVCAICGGPANGRGDLHVDHCHATGKFRGLLCSNCNRMLGFAKDSVATLQNAINYLRGKR